MWCADCKGVKVHCISYVVIGIEYWCKEDLLSRLDPVVSHRPQPQTVLGSDLSFTTYYISPTPHFPYMKNRDNISTI